MPRNWSGDWHYCLKDKIDLQTQAQFTLISASPPDLLNKYVFNRLFPI